MPLERCPAHRRGCPGWLWDDQWLRLGSARQCDETPLPDAAHTLLPSVDMNEIAEALKSASSETLLVEGGSRAVGR